MVHKTDYVDNGTPLVNPTNIVSNNISDIGICRVSQSKYNELLSYVLQEKDILLARRGDLSKCAIVSEQHEGWLAGTGSFFLHLNGIDEQFFIMVYASPYVQTYLVGDSIGTTMNNLNQGLLSQLLVPIPPYKEQKRIYERYISVLPLTNKYEKQHQDKKTLDVNIYSLLKKSILQEAIQGRLVPQCASDEPVAILLQRIKEEKQRLVKEGKLKKGVIDSTIFRGDDSKYYEQIGKKISDISEEIQFEIPPSWEWCRISTLISLLSGRDLDPTQYNSSHKGIPYITGASNIENETLLINRWTETPVTISHKGDLLLTCKGTIGKLAYNSIGEIHIARQIMAISSVYIYMPYLRLFICSQISEFQKKAQSMIPGIAREAVLNAIIPVPPYHEQIRIANKVEELYVYL